jgi:hypothetical protein
MPQAQLPDVIRVHAPVRIPPNPDAPTRAQIERLQSAMAPIHCAQPEPEHIFHPGWYERRLLIPAGMLIIGKVHRHVHPVGVLRGHALLIDQFGRREVRAGFFGASQPGAKRVVYCFEETLFFTLHRNPSNTRDLGEIEAEHIEPEEFELLGRAPDRGVLQ